MKRYIPLGLLMAASMILLGCSTQRTPMLNSDLTQEVWMRQVVTNPSYFTRGADAWFLAGKPNAAERATRHSAYSMAAGTMSVNVPAFTRIQIDGNFQVQLFGAHGPNSVYLYGVNDAIRSVVVEVKNNTLCLTQVKKASPNVRKLIVRIGVNQLNQLIHSGQGVVEGVQLRSNGLSVMSYASGNMYLSGDMRLRSVVKTGQGNVSILGANTPVLDIKATGLGEVNVSGNVGVRSIVHHGRTDINIIGANTNGLKIYADGRGKVGIQGVVNLNEVVAKDFARVYVYKVMSPALYVTASGKAQVGLAGSATNAYIDAFRYSCVGAKFLCADAIYARAHDKAHINISGKKIFAAAVGNGSVYFFGSPEVMSQFVAGQGMVIPIWGKTAYCPVTTVSMSGAAYKADNVKRHTSYKKWKQEQQGHHPRKPLRLKGEG